MGDEAKPAAVPGQLMDIGTVAAANIVKALGLNDSDTETVKQAIRDEISAMSSHFTMAVADAQFQFERQVFELKSSFKYVRENHYVVAAVGAALVLGGFLLGVLVRV